MLSRTFTSPLRRLSINALVKGVIGEGKSPVSLSDLG
jgi:hypothetical protein